MIRLVILIEFLGILLILAADQNTFGLQRNLTTKTVNKKIAKTTKNIGNFNSEEFQKWSKKYRKSYNKNYVKSKSEAARDFQKNRRNILEHNLRPNETYKRKLQSHSDLSFEEKKMYRMGINIEVISQFEVVPLLDNLMLDRKVSRARVNYTDLFPPAKDQGYCGACYAFSSVSLLEYYSRLIGRNDLYSEQCLLDCDSSNGGCDGGWPTNALMYIRDSGISDGYQYPYEGVNSTCRKDLFQPVQTINNVCTYQLNGNEKKLKLLVDQGPVIACVTTTDGFTSYSSGIFYDNTCRSNEVDHAITIVGYGSEGAGKDYWIIRNSWGKQWGMNGYGLMARNKKNHCGIALFAIVIC